MYNFSNSAIFVSSGDSFSDQTVSGSVIQLSRVQNAGFSIDFSRELLEYSNQSIEDQRFNTALVSFNCDYLITNGFNEKAVGFSTDSITGALLSIGQNKNIYILHKNAGQANYLNDPENVNIYAIGNCLINSYSVNASVGSLLSANFSAEGLNVVSYTGIPLSLQSPALDNYGDLYGNFFSIYSGSQFFDKNGEFEEQIAALGKGDILMEIPIDFGFSTQMSGVNSCALQDFSLTLTVGNESIYQMGTPIPKRQLNMPILMELNTSAILTKIQADSIVEQCSDAAQNIKINVSQPCSDFRAIQFELKGLKLHNQEVAENLFDRVKMSFSWRGYIPSIKSLTNNFIINIAPLFNENNSYKLNSSVSSIGYDNFGQPFLIEDSTFSKA